LHIISLHDSGLLVFKEVNEAILYSDKVLKELGAL